MFVDKKVLRVLKVKHFKHIFPQRKLSSVTFLKQVLLSNPFETTKRVSNKFDPFETRRYSVSHLNPKCLLRVSIECRQGDI